VLEADFFAVGEGGEDGVEEELFGVFGAVDEVLLLSGQGGGDEVVGAEGGEEGVEVGVGGGGEVWEDVCGGAVYGLAGAGLVDFVWAGWGV